MCAPTLLETKQICRKTFVCPSNVDLELGVEQYLHKTLSVNQHIIHNLEISHFLSLFAACQ